MKKILAIVLAIVLCFACVACSGSNSDNTTKAAEDSTESKAAEESTEANTESFKVGFIFLHDENSTYDANFMKAAEAACKAMGVEIVKKTNIPEDDSCYTAAIELVDDGCKAIFADSFSHEGFLLKAAKEHPEVQFCHATGTNAHTEKLANFHNAFAAIYEGRYLAGVAAGLKINEMIKNGTEINGTKVTAETAKIGYVGAYPYAEVKSGYTSFYLGAKSVCPTVTMDVKFTGSWYDETLEQEAATTLINDGCILISQHADSMGAPNACEEAGVPDVSYNGSTVEQCPDTFIVSSYIDWQPYFEYMIKSVADGTEMDADWTGTIATGSVKLTDINEDVAAEGTADKIAEVQADIEAGKVHVFDTSTFTVNGKTLESYEADVDSDEAYTPDTEVVSDGYFHESEYRSAPYFAIDIDGITVPEN